MFNITQCIISNIIIISRKKSCVIQYILTRVLKFKMNLNVTTTTITINIIIIEVYIRLYHYII
jgi:hypothetical protein